MTNRAKPPVLWVDDTPDQPLGKSGTLRAVMEEILAEEFEIRIARNRDEAVAAIKSDHKFAIRLVLLDVQFPEPSGDFLPERQGQAIAKELFDLREGMLKKVAPEGLLKFLVLTTVTGLVNIGNQGCKIEHVVKEELVDRGPQEYFRNLVRGIVRDFDNAHLVAEWEPAKRKLLLRMTVDGQPFEKAIDIPPAHSDFLSMCLQYPNKSLQQGDSGDAAKAFKDINEKVRMVTGGRVWGLLARLHRGEVMAVIPGKNIKCPHPSEPQAAPTRLVTAVEFNRFKGEINKLLEGALGEIAELHRWRKEVATWRKDVDALVKRDHEWLENQSAALNRILKSKRGTSKLGDSKA